MYVPGPDKARAAERTACSYNKALSRAVDQPVSILRDFNSCDINDHLPNLEQFVTLLTRDKCTLDNCYSNTPNAFAARRKSPLEKSDHDVAHLLPRYRQKLKTEEKKKKINKK